MANIIMKDTTVGPKFFLKPPGANSLARLTMIPVMMRNTIMIRGSTWEHFVLRLVPAPAVIKLAVILKWDEVTVKSEKILTEYAVEIKFTNPKSEFVWRFLGTTNNCESRMST